MHESDCSEAARGDPHNGVRLMALMVDTGSILVTFRRRCAIFLLSCVTVGFLGCSREPGGMPTAPSKAAEFFPTENATYALHVFPRLIRAPRAIVFVTILQDAVLPGPDWRVERWTERGWVPNGLTWGASDISDSFGGTGHGPDTGSFEYYAAYEPYKAGDEVALLFDMRGQLPGDRVRLSHSVSGSLGSSNMAQNDMTRPPGP
jgi:hypothetical protein